MKHKTKTYTSEQASQMAKEVGDFDASPKHLKREILALKKRVAELENMQYPNQRWHCHSCDFVWYGEHNSKCPECRSVD